VSKNGDTWTFSYTAASCGLVNGQHLVNSDLQTGYTRTVVSFTDNPGTKTVVVLTRPTKLAELLDSGSLQSVTFSEIPGAGPSAQGALEAGLNFHYNYNLERKFYQDANFVIGLRPSSQLDLNAAFDINANFKWFKLTSFEAMFRGSADFTLEAYVYATGAYNRSDETPLITPIRKVYATMIGVVPVWLELVFEINAGYDLQLAGSAGYTNGFNAVKTIKAGRRWDTTQGWTTIRDNPELGFSRLGPKWQVEASGNLQVWLQPKVTVYAYSVAGAWADLKPYAELDARLQVNPYEFELGLYGGLSSTVGLDLRGWDDSWGNLPSHTFDLIPRAPIWEYSSAAAAPPQITSPAGQPQPQAVSVGGTATFSVQASGATPLSYRWQRDANNLTEGGRITGTRSSTLRIANGQTSDAGNYRVVVSNPNGSVTSQSAQLTVYSGSVPSGMALIPGGSFPMGDTFNDSDDSYGERPVHSVYVSEFYMDKYEVTKALWDEVRVWANANGYDLGTIGAGKAPNHPVQTVNWYDAVKWCNARSEKEGRVPAYYTSAAQTTVYRTGAVNVQNDWVKWNSGYRLPTEAEWEKAARGGASGRRFPWGDMDTITHSRANYYSSSNNPYDVSPMRGYHPTFATGGQPYTSPVGYFAANGYGLYDMAGNVWEWCWDWYQSNWYSQAGATQTDPRGPLSASYGSRRVLRGVAWSDVSYSPRCAYRGDWNWGGSNNSIGFRCVRGL
jgi:formylglycine-generating enzyme required for sulfatase activity